MLRPAAVAVEGCCSCCSRRYYTKQRVYKRVLSVCARGRRLQVFAKHRKVPADDGRSIRRRTTTSCRHPRRLQVADEANERWFVRESKLGAAWPALRPPHPASHLDEGSTSSSWLFAIEVDVLLPYQGRKTSLGASTIALVDVLFVSLDVDWNILKELLPIWRQRLDVDGGIETVRDEEDEKTPPSACFRRGRPSDHRQLEVLEPAGYGSRVGFRSLVLPPPPLFKAFRFEEMD